MKTLRLKRAALFVFFGLFLITGVLQAKSAREIDASVDTALSRFEREVPGARELLTKSRGVLIFPSVIKAGFGIGGEYGVGSLLKKKSKGREYYNIMSGSIGFQFGGQSRSIYMLFMDPQALENFRTSDGWKAGVDGSVAVINVGANGSVDTTKTNQPILAFVLGQKGLMYNLTLEGSKFNRIQPEN